MSSESWRPDRHFVPAGSVDRRIWVWRIYKIVPWKTGWKCVSLLSHYPLPNTPAEFYWTNVLDIDGLKKYIDAVLTGQETDALQFLERGQVLDIQLHPPAPCEMYEVPADVLVNYLLLRGSISVPINGVLRIYAAKTNNEQRYVTSDFLGALAPLLIDEEAKQIVSSKVESVSASEVPIVVDTAMYASSPPQEMCVRKKNTEKYAALVTKVQHQSQVYYVKRVFDLASQRLIYAASSWYPHGPWIETVRDNAALLALQVSLEEI